LVKNPPAMQETPDHFLGWEEKRSAETGSKTTQKKPVVVDS